MLISMPVDAAAGGQPGVELVETGRALRELARREDRRLSQDVEPIAGLGAGVPCLDGEEAGIFEALQGAGLAAPSFALASPASGDGVAIAPGGDVGDEVDGGQPEALAGRARAHL